MTGDGARMMTISRTGAVAAAAALIIAGGATALFVERMADRNDRSPSVATPPAVAVSPATPREPSNLDQDRVVVLTPEMAKRAGIEMTTIAPEAASRTLRIPGVVQPDAYREVMVTSLTDGRVTRVMAELGQRVAQGALLAEVYSPQLTELQTSYLGMRADLDAAHERLARAERLVEIGAASRQELEQVRAEHTHHLAAAEAARSRLVLLGIPPERVDKLSPSDTSATVAVTAPIAGIVTKRDVNAGLNVQTGASLFTVVDLSTVWIVADLYEGSFSAVKVGSQVTVTADAYPGLSFDGRVSYIDPQLQESTRTAKIRIELPNRGEQLRFGMFVNVMVAMESGRSGISIPRSAVQTIGNRHIVYIADPGREGRFLEREVELGAASDTDVSVLRGVGPGDRVVSAGAFFLRAERERAAQ